MNSPSLHNKAKLHSVFYMYIRNIISRDVWDRGWTACLMSHVWWATCRFIFPKRQLMWKFGTVERNYLSISCLCSCLYIAKFCLLFFYSEITFLYQILCAVKFHKRSLIYFLLVDILHIEYILRCFRPICSAMISSTEVMITYFTAISIMLIATRGLWSYHNIDSRIRGTDHVGCYRVIR